MTVGEKIQEYRKNLGMSQDELGQKLLTAILCIYGSFAFTF